MTAVPCTWTSTTHFHGCWTRNPRSAFPCERVGMIIAGYEVNHCHIHLVPTTDMTQLSFANAATGIDRSALEDHAARIVDALSRR